ncbi:MAG: hypothetical protein ACFCVK_20120 [Acidimicrobiales bacterium]
MDALHVPPDEESLIDRTLRSITSPGPTLHGGRRRQLAALARALRVEPEAPVPDGSLERFAATVTVEAHTIRPEMITDLRAAGSTDAQLVEVVSLVARLTAVDTFCFGVGIAPVELEAGAEGEPTGRVDPGAGIDGGWLPTVGTASPPNALSLLPDEHQAMHDVHGVLYLAVAEMADLDADRGLHRTQMELVAARTSLLNECFF